MSDKILYTGGTFDLFHYGHVNFLKQCSKLCDNVVVALNTDEFVAQYKNPTIMNYEERRKSLLSCQYVRSVIPNEGGSDSKPAILSVKPDIIAIGDDWAKKDYYKQMNFTQEWLEEQGIVLVYIPYTRGVSSSDIRKRILSLQPHRANKLAFVVCTKESKYIYECVDRIKKYYGDSADIIIVDSCSTDKKYFELKDKYSNVFIEDICNKNYEYGSIIHGFKKYNDYETYVFIQDSVYVDENIPQIGEIKNDEVYVFGTDAVNSGWNYDHLAKTEFYEKHKNFPVLDGHTFMIAEWNSFVINKQTFNKVINSSIFAEALPPDKKFLSSSWERVWAIIFIKNQIKMESLYQKAKYYKIFGNRV